MILGICLREEARIVQASLDEAQRRSYHTLSTALAHSSAPKEMVHLHQVELKVCRKKGPVSMADLGRDIAKVVILADPKADTPTREVFGNNAFWRRFQGVPAR